MYCPSDCARTKDPSFAGAPGSTMMTSPSSNSGVIDSPTTSSAKGSASMQEPAVWTDSDSKRRSSVKSQITPFAFIACCASSHCTVLHRLALCGRRLTPGITHRSNAAYALAGLAAISRPSAEYEKTKSRLSECCDTATAKYLRTRRPTASLLRSSRPPSRVKGCGHGILSRRKNPRCRRRRLPS